MKDVDDNYDLKDEVEECEICHRNFERFNLIKCKKQVCFPTPHSSPSADPIIVCTDCNYRMYLTELTNIERLIALHEEVCNKLAPILKEFNEKRDEIVSDSIISVVGTHSVTKRPTLDLLYKYPHWEIYEKLQHWERIRQGELYDNLISAAKYLKVWDGNRVDGVTSKKLKNIKEKEKNEGK